jgi:hypothetical protein
MECRRSTRDRSRGPKAKPPPEQLPGKKKKPAAKKITTNVKDNSPLDATGNDGGVPVDATGDDVDEPSDAPGDDGGEHVVDATCDDVDEPLDAPGDDGGKHVVDATGDDVDEPLNAPGDDGGQHVDATGYDVDEPLDAPGHMHHPQFKKPYKSDMLYLKQLNHPSPTNPQTLTQPPTSNETAKPNEKDSSYSSSSDSSTSSSNSNRDQSQSSKSKKKGTAELLSENKDTSPMIKGMDVMESEAAKYKFEREKKVLMLAAFRTFQTDSNFMWNGSYACSTLGQEESI